MTLVSLHFGCALLSASAAAGALELHRPHYDAGKSFLFVGRIPPQKRLARAVAIARPAGLPLKIAAVSRHCYQYSLTEVAMHPPGA